ncbi:hypothetical protein [Microvirga massiliensis]|uniref:hypothetical protein n=1 Tax=Microvirga massiliensis TaxID=1033741 RepID=UPI00062B53DA|nr:hypothetical protein [Microvirga massiliensis]
MNVTFRDNDTGQEWIEDVEIPPRPGDHVVLDRAPKGLNHIVRQITHRIGGGEQRVTIRIDRVTSLDNG